MKKLFFILLIAVAANGQEILTLEDCIDLALKTNPDVKISQYQIDLGQEQQKQSKNALLPTLDFESSYKKQSHVPEINISEMGFGAIPGFNTLNIKPVEMGVKDSYDFRLTLSQPLFTGFSLKNNLLSSNSLLKSKEYEKKQNRLQLIYKVESAYANICLLKKQIEILEVSKKQITSHLNDIKNYFDQGLARYDEVMSVKVRLSEADLSLIKGQNALETACAVLASLVGRDISVDETLKTLEINTMETVTINESIQMALDNRVEFDVLNSNKQALTFSKKAVSGAKLPNVFAYASYGYGKPGLDYVKKDWMDYWVAGLGLKWNLWNWKTTGSKVQQVKIKINVLEQNWEQLERMVTLEVKKAGYWVNEAVKSFNVTQQMVNQAEEAYNVVVNSYKNGQATNSQVLDAQSDLNRAKLEQARTELNYFLAKSNWRHALGISEKYYHINNN